MCRFRKCLLGERELLLFAGTFFLLIVCACDTAITSAVQAECESTMRQARANVGDLCNENGSGREGLRVKLCGANEVRGESERASCYQQHNTEPPSLDGLEIYIHL